MLDLEQARELRAERNARVRAGAALCARDEPPPESAGAELAGAWREARRLVARRTELDARLAESLELDRRDYRACASALGRALVVARGLLERLRLREEAWRERSTLGTRLSELAQVALDDAGLAARIPAGERAEIERARAAVQRATRARVELLAPYGGAALPAWLRALLGELALFGRFLREELTRKLLLRLPALAAMAVAWWLTRRYTTSAFEAGWHSLTGEGRAGLSRATLERLQFWLPLVAAALTAYLATTLARRVRRRYGADVSADPR